MCFKLNLLEFRAIFFKTKTVYLNGVITELQSVNTKKQLLSSDWFSSWTTSLNKTLCYSTVNISNLLILRSELR